MESPSSTELPNSQNPEDSFVYSHAASGFYHDPNAGTTECSSSDAPESHPPPSEWLEDTLIELYLSGYSNLEANAGDHDTTVYPETFVPDGNSDCHELNECKSVAVDHGAVIESSEIVSDEGGSWEEENWRAQYGQVIQEAEVPIPESLLISLWDWEMVTKPRNDGKREVPRLVGRLAKQSAKLHPSLPSGGGLLKTAPICEVHLDLGETLGKTMKGLVEPIQAQGNIGSAGLGWPQGRLRH